MIMASKKMIDMLNAQLNFEYFSANIYLQMAGWAAKNGMEGCTKFLLRQAEEEREHMQRFFDYVVEMGEMPIVGALDCPATEYSSIKDIFETSLAHEKIVTSRIHEIAGLAHDEKDFVTMSFIQWFIEEQREEEENFNGIMDKLNLIGEGESKSLYFFDKEISAFNDKLLAADTAE
jgi:ferritin